MSFLFFEYGNFGIVNRCLFQFVSRKWTTFKEGPLREFIIFILLMS